MEQVLQLLADYQWWIYAVLGLVLLFYLRRALLARRAGARSIFALEQEQERRRYSRSVMAAAVTIVVLGTVFVLSNPIVLPSGETESTASPTTTTTAGPLPVSTLTPTALPATATPTPTATVARPTRAVMPTATVQAVEAPTPVVRPPACPDPNVRITSPGINQAVNGPVPIRGTALHDNFQYYKIEIGVGNDPQNWSVVGQLHYNVVNNGVLETLNSGGYAPGRYTLRLVVVDQTGNYPPPCQVTIEVRR
ncbi:MAG TPA: hypothetical protein VLC95_20475 [Anaerolineae bacterium]|nr:hypothetical protein [Anaerolineae bacterium]